MKVLTPLLMIIALASPSWAAVDVQMNAGKYYTAVLKSGSVHQRYDIVFIGDGFTSSDQATFNARVNDAVTALQGLVPYSERMCAFNVWRVNVVSAESGVDHPKDNVFKNTELDCRYGNPGNGEAERCIRSDSPAKCFEAANYAPDHDAIFVLVNDAEWGGCAGGLVFSSTAPGFGHIITHELGHKIGGLADEYECYVCDGSDDNRTYTGSEPTSANLTRNTNRSTTKWGGMIASTTPIPTVVNNPPDVIGLWEGGGYYRFGIFRPQISCQMRSNAPFCGVCRNAMRSTLETHCDYCDLHPTSVVCWWDDWKVHKYLIWDRPFRWRWPFPPCLSCPPERLVDEIVYVIDGAPPELKMSIYDDHGGIVAEGHPTDRGLEARFQASRASQYTVELVGAESRTKKSLTLTSSIIRNGVRDREVR